MLLNVSNKIKLKYKLANQFRKTLYRGDIAHLIILEIYGRWLVADFLVIKFPGELL